MGWVRSLVTVLSLALAALAAGCGGPAAATASAGQVTVWVDDVRAPGVQQYIKDHPGVDIHLVTIPNQPGYILTKVSLANQSKKGWPDMVFLNEPADIAALASPTYDYAASLNQLVPSSTRAGFVPGALDGCTFNGNVDCLRNDVGQTVLWYDQKLMAQFGYDVPKTWADYQAVGERVAKEHPGYIIGLLNGKWGAGTFFTSSNCPTIQTIDLQTARIDLNLPECTRVAQMLQPLTQDKVVVPLAPSDPGLAQTGKAGKILMMPGPSWYGLNNFKNTWTVPAGEMAAAPMPTWPGSDQPTSAVVGGGSFVISRHASAAQQKVVADLITWLTTDIAYQKTQPTYPAFGPAGEAWCQAVAAGNYFAGNPCPVFKQEAGLDSKVDGYVRYSADWQNSFNGTVVKAAGDGSSLMQALTQWQAQLTQSGSGGGL